MYTGEQENLVKYLEEALAARDSNQIAYLLAHNRGLSEAHIYLDMRDWGSVQPEAIDPKLYNLLDGFPLPGGSKFSITNGGLNYNLALLTDAYGSSMDVSKWKDMFISRQTPNEHWKAESSTSSNAQTTQVSTSTQTIPAENVDQPSNANTGLIDFVGKKIGDFADWAKQEQWDFYSGQVEGGYFGTNINRVTGYKMGYSFDMGKGTANPSFEIWQNIGAGVLGNPNAIRNIYSKYINNQTGAIGSSEAVATVNQNPGNVIVNKGASNAETVSSEALSHSNIGEFTYNPKTGEVSKMKSGGHGQANIDFLEANGMEYNIVTEYPNGVRVGNVPDHKVKLKRNDINQSWFPKSWSENDIKMAGEGVANMPGNTGVPDGVAVFGIYNGVRVGVIRTNGKIATVFPDAAMQP